MPLRTADKATQGAVCLTAIVCLSLLSGCNTPIDRDNEVNACELLSANPYLLQTTLATSASPETQAQLLSTITIESNHIANARPVATWYWKPYIVKKYRSSSQSYSQGTDATWLDFSRAQKRLVNRHSYYDNLQFIHWYYQSRLQQVKKGTLSESDKYLLYHEGPGGFRSRRYQNNSVLLRTAKRFEELTTKQRQSLSQCKNTLWWQSRWLTF